MTTATQRAESFVSAYLKSFDTASDDAIWIENAIRRRDPGMALIRAQHRLESAYIDLRLPRITAAKAADLYAELLGIAGSAYSVQASAEYVRRTVEALQDLEEKWLTLESAAQSLTALRTATADISLLDTANVTGFSFSQWPHARAAIFNCIDALLEAIQAVQDAAETGAEALVEQIKRRK